MMLENGVLWR